MSDPLDRDISQAIKASADRSLAGWTFTPEMRKAVLDQIADEPALTAEPAPQRRSKPNLVRPLSWFAAAAAVVLVSFNMVPKMLNESGDSPNMTALKSAPAPQEAPPQSAGDAHRGVADNAGENPEATAAALTMEAPGAGSDEPIMMLGVPEQVPTEPDPDAPVGATVGPRTVGHLPETRGSRIVLVAPVRASLTGQEAQGGGSEIGIMATTLSDLPGPMATAPDGRIAVAEGALLQFYTAKGQPDGSLALDAPPFAVALGPADLVAVVDESGANLLDGEQVVSRVEGVQAASLAFAGDGTLALLTQDGAERSLRLYAADGSILTNQSVQGEGQGLAFTGDGQQIIAGSQVFDRSGRLLWEVPFPPAQVSAFGSALLAWNHQVVGLFQAQDGSEIWSAEYPEGAILQAAGSAAGDRVAVVGDSAAGTTAWVLDVNGAQQYAERLDLVPLGLGIEGDSLILLTGQGLEVRSLQP